MGSELDPELIARLAVLRRRKGVRDRSLKLGSLGPLFQDVAREYVRYLGSSQAGTRYYVVPVRLPVGDAPPHLVEHLRGFRLAVATAGKYASGASGAADLDGLMNNMTMSSGGTNGHAEMSGLVPDGVAAVELAFPDGKTDRVRVRSNFWVLVRSEVSLNRVHVTWRDGRGDVVRSFPHGYGGE